MTFITLGLHLPQDIKLVKPHLQYIEDLKAYLVPEGETPGSRVIFDLGDGFRGL